MARQLQNEALLLDPAAQLDWPLSVCHSLMEAKLIWPYLPTEN
jgi:hypothetical protein